MECMPSMRLFCIVLPRTHVHMLTVPILPWLSGTQETLMTSACVMWQGDQREGSQGAKGFFAP